ncbi:MAG: hypothetical protein LBN30_07985 [Oscillospiraceae bacterium]|jgi:hypothetical protein|nr:hypothetical protein [Oscillospiraceae bacterium]
MPDYKTAPELLREKVELLHEIRIAASGKSFPVKPEMNFGDENLWVGIELEIVKILGVAPETLSRMSGADLDIVRDLYDGKAISLKKFNFELGQYSRFCTILMHHVPPRDPNRRMKAVIRKLREYYSAETLALYACVERGKFEAFAENPDSVTDAEKSALSAALMYLFGGLEACLSAVSR